MAVARAPLEKFAKKQMAISLLGSESKGKASMHEAAQSLVF
jgi:hypothetical protein